MTEHPADLGTLYRGRRGRVGFVDVPPLDYLMISGAGEPGGAEFTAAAQALHAVSHGARVLVRHEYGAAPKAMPLEALWWVEDPVQKELLAAVALGMADPGDRERRGWRWQAMIVQPEQVDDNVVKLAVEGARRKGLAALDELRFERWAEGRAAQVLHVGPYSAQGPAVAALHHAIEAAGYCPRGRQHEIYLRDPRRTAPERLRTLLRQPVEPA